MSKNKIFIVEDEEKMVKELTLTLNKYGYSTSFSFDFEHIVDCIINDNPDLVLLDINLPYYDGFYICRELRKSSNIPIIVVTSRDSDMDELMSINLGADDFITKPYNTQILLARIGALLKEPIMIALLKHSSLGISPIIYPLVKQFFQLIKLN